MIIQCPACGARAKLPESQEGAKVRCAECSRVYVARDPANKGRSRQRSSPTLPIVIGAGLLIVVVAVLMSRGGDELQGAPELEQEPELHEPSGQVTSDPWESEVVVFARGLHDLAFQRETFDLSNSISFPHVWAKQRLELAEGEELPSELDIAGFAALSGSEVDELRNGVLQALHSEEPANLPGNWSPFDGEIVEQTDTSARLRLTIKPRDEAYGVGTRNIEWRLAQVDGKWKAWSWERWISPEEARSMRTARRRSYEQTTLTDGSVVIEAEPAPIAYMDETPVAQRQEIDALIEKLIDLELPAKELTRVKAELEIHGKHAIPALLTRFYHMNQEGFADMDAAIQAQLVHQSLSDITGYVTSFKAHDVLGSTKERRDSGVRQWYGWYHKHFKKFDAREEGTDGLEEAIEFTSERERRDYERAKKQIEQEEAERRAREEAQADDEPE